MHRVHCCGVFECLVASLATVAALAAVLSVQAAEPRGREPRLNNSAEEGTDDSTTSDNYRLREGLTLEEEVGEFRDAGGRITFYPSGRKTTLTVLENLALERVYTELEMRREQRQWSVTGVITEYRAGNYLQITRAVMKPRESSSGKATRRTSPAKTKDATPRD